jgi:hypothetical protein
MHTHASLSLSLSLKNTAHSTNLKYTTVENILMDGSLMDTKVFAHASYIIFAPTYSQALASQNT